VAPRQSGVLRNEKYATAPESNLLAPTYEGLTSVVSAIGRKFSKANDNYIQIDASINQGHSGGLLKNMKGKTAFTRK
jgi:hypothetical protein